MGWSKWQLEGELCCKALKCFLLELGIWSLKQRLLVHG